MTLIETWGGATANCYIGLTAADSFISASVIDQSVWTAANSVQKSAALLEATRDVDSKQYRGDRYFYEQALQFPRSWEDSNWPYSFTYSSTPNLDVEQERSRLAVERATCYQAMWLLRNNGRNYHAERIASGLRHYAEAIGPISESATYAGGSVERLCPDALTLLAPYIVGRRALRG